MFSKNLSCGEGEIRTLGRLTPTPVFETGSFNHSDTSPSVKQQFLFLELRDYVFSSNQLGNHFCNHLATNYLKMKYPLSSFGSPQACNPKKVLLICSLVVFE